MSDQNALVISDQAELSIEDVKNQVQKIQQLMKSVMREGEHYGTIPGTNKPSLYKAGAEKLGFIFRLMPDFKITRRDLPDGHREYDIVCTLKHMQSGKVVGQGVGNCSTLESKYRYRYTEENTGEAVPGDYWKIREKNPKGAQQLLGGFGFKARKIDGAWAIVKQGDRIENPDIADSYNTVMKMAKKRAHVDAMITACAASDIFIQDLEDFAGEGESGSTQKSTKNGQKQGKNSGKDTKKGENGKVEDPIRQDYINEITELLNSGFFTQKEQDDVQALISQAVENKKLLGLKQVCLQVIEKRKAKKKRQEEGSGGANESLDAAAEEGWNAGDKEPKSGGEPPGEEEI